MAGRRDIAFLNRRYSQRRFYIAVAISMALHLVFIAFFAYRKGPGLIRKFHTPMHMVELAAPKPASAPTPPAPVVSKPKPVKKAAPKPKPKAKARPKPKPKPKAKTIPKKAKDPVPKRTEQDVIDRIAKMREAQAAKDTPPAPQRTEADVQSRIDQLRERYAETQPAPATKPTSTTQTATGTKRGGGVKGTLAMMRFTAYKNKVWAHVKANWIVPPSLKGRSLKAITSITIDREGKILKHWIEESSGNESFDQSTIKALLRANPLPAVPSEIPDEEIADGFGFEFK